MLWQSLQRWTPGNWLVRHFESEDGDLPREIIKTFAEALMSAEAQAVCNAGYGDVKSRGQLARPDPPETTLALAAVWMAPVVGPLAGRRAAPATRYRSELRDLDSEENGVTPLRAC